MKFGRRPVMIATLVVFVAALAGCSAAQTYSQLMALRVLQSFGSGVCEAIPVQLVNEIVLDTKDFTHLSSSFTKEQAGSAFTQWRYVLEPQAHYMRDICLMQGILGDFSSGSY